ncbi:hypothetical protein AVEN_118351-1 [Araneus ventricosus]|uniref:Transposase Tc1-like domain-containing protein n=1 Tax=Araneus ventricosus TaxID=182803 RepID=A0A4Y2B5X8_ARAVE|nr:hypothetical protein AVEN_118351-1 [Araneus ventricosus]
MLQFASSDSSTESLIAKAESMSRRNNLLDEMRWRAVGCCKLVQDNLLLPESRMCIVVSSIDCGTITKGIKTPVEDVGLDVGESPQQQTIATCCRRTLTARQLASQLSDAAGRPVSRQTLSRRLHEGGLFLRRPVVCVPLFPAHARARLHWAREHRSWTLVQWSHVLFTDESLFNIQNDFRRAMIWREPGTRYREPNIVERYHYRGGGLLV